MDLEQTIIFTNALSLKHRGKEIIEVERFILKGAWENADYETMASESGYARNYLNSLAAPKIWKLYRETIGFKISKSDFRTFFEKKEYSDFYSVLKDLPEFIRVAEKYSNRVSGGEIIVGRYAELKELSKLIDSNKYIEIFGISGIGKSALARKWLDWVDRNEQYQSRWEGFHYIPIRRNYKSVEPLIIDLCHELEIEINEDSQCSELFIDKIVKTKNVVIIDFDNYKIDNEVIFDLSNFLKSIIDRDHQSCIVFIFREPKFSYGILLNREKTANFLQVKEIDSSDAEKMLKEYKLVGDINWNSFVKGYRGNPLALKMIASYIENYLGGDFNLFNQMKTIFMNPDLESMLQEQYSRLTNEEKIFLYNLSNLYYEVPSITQFNFEQLCEKFPAGMDKLIQSLRKFENLMLLERIPDDGHALIWTLPPIVRKYSHSMPHGIILAL